MTTLRPQSLQSRFLLGLGAIVLLVGVFFSASMYFHLKDLLHSQVVDKAELMLAQVDSVQQYVRTTLRPKMYTMVSDDQFVIEAMSSSYISRKVMDRLNMEKSQYLYRRVSENARNPKFEINELERGLMQEFRADPELAFWEGYRNIKGVEYFLTARPVVFAKKCMHCHGSPDKAPKVLLERYGDRRGFGRKVGEIGGIDLVGLPVDSAVSQIRDATVGYVGIYASGMLIFFTVVQFFFNRLVTHNLHRLTRVFRERFKDQEEIRVLDKVEQKDEIEEVVQGMEELGDHLVNVQNQLRDYAANLECMVERRTEELSIEAAERQSDVALFVLLLDKLNRARSRHEMWHSALPEIARRFEASSAAFICMLATQNYYSWPEGLERPEMPENWREILTESVPLFEPGRAVIPVGADDSVNEGLLFVTWDHGVDLKQQDRTLLRALGQQIGIAMENLGALDNLVRQKDLLQSVVEGIADPLLFMDGNCTVVLANQGARTLGDSLAGLDDDSDEGDGAQKLIPALFSECYGQEGSDCPLRQTMDRGQPDQREVGTPDGRHFSVSMYPVGDADRRLVVYVREVTNEKRMLARMRQSEKLATVGKFASGLAHEMNNPLGVIKCYGELLRNAAPSDQAREDVDVIMRHATQAQNVLQDLLNFARPAKLAAEDATLGEVVRGAVRSYGVQAETLGVGLKAHVDPQAGDFVLSRQAGDQILSNLLGNALDALEGSEDGRIDVDVSCSADKAEVVLSVCDNGPGVPPDVLESIFDPFFSTKDVGKGTGLGLAVVYGIIKDMGGSIDVSAGAGARFVVRFPARNNDTGKA
ncbi:c-type heme family protein [Pseudodesulfovibrio senegalensis]|uniref:histidine kinase n=1 Tax=Pseudodesulfovibrio senegalensis TaxID=1721087 RepID=A0A6N6N5K5_9BACT|nr:DUF3365 domain-containing protein [Pseudodesulfovibrio senegalensis]KAB1443058.1 DUF3365 domain-containing protein [Pseudodesulfovibrio senegalensis]